MLLKEANTFVNLLLCLCPTRVGIFCVVFLRKRIALLWVVNFTKLHVLRIVTSYIKIRSRFFEIVFAVFYTCGFVADFKSDKSKIS